MPPPPEPDLLAALRAGTRRQHHEVERVLGLPGRIRSRADLAATLAGMLAGWQPVEDALAAVDWRPLGLADRLGAAADLIRADLRELAASGDAPPAGGDPGTGAAAPRFGTLARAVGGRYVLLGSALGGRIIAPVVDRRLGPGATRFFRRAGLDPEGDWAAFRAAVADHRWHPEQRAEAVVAAVETFDAIGRAAARTLAARRPD
ncbi:biliverdin-producing heme oxygenase [Micromonospora sp. CPCC 205711]|uniref:biliverdin-producing heme oxygenase n=1 Tax=Micromonospora sp. CPCC 205547 TaxID=3122400 RepID=UPI002FF046CB